MLDAAVYIIGVGLDVLGITIVRFRVAASMTRIRSNQSLSEPLAAIETPMDNYE
jgi:hypothetical protein